VNAWPLIALMALVTFATKGVGPAVMTGRDLPAPVTSVVTRLAAALLAALVVVNALADGRAWHLGADTAGVGVAALLVWRRAPVLVVVLSAAVTAALVRRLGLLD
jgi:branched-subunit amino acid transport protein